MSDWQDATDPVPPRRGDDGLLRVDGALPKAEKQKSSPLKGRSQKPEAIDKMRAGQQRRRIREGRFYHKDFLPAGLDSDFDEMGA